MLLHDPTHFHSPFFSHVMEDLLLGKTMCNLVKNDAITTVHSIECKICEKVGRRVAKLEISLLIEGQKW